MSRGAQLARPESPRIERLKAEAKAMKESTPGLKHHAALLAIARREGFRTWEDLVADDLQDGSDDQPSEQQVSDAMRRAIVYGRTR